MLKCCCVSPLQVDPVVITPKTEKLAAAGSESFFEVFVSACNHPGQFWVQVGTPYLNASLLLFFSWETNFTCVNIR